VTDRLTAHCVLINMDTNVHPELINSRFAHVSVARASHELQFYTNNVQLLAGNLGREVNKASALDFNWLETPANATFEHTPSRKPLTTD
jgi:hypothetical protein